VCLDPGQDTSNTTILYGSYGFESKLFNELGHGMNPPDKASPAALSARDKTVVQVSIGCADGTATLDSPNLAVSYQNQNIQWLNNGYTFSFTLPKGGTPPQICDGVKDGNFNNGVDACILLPGSASNVPYNYTLTVVGCAHTLDATLTVNP
jgi:hypothetical protein